MALRYGTTLLAAAHLALLPGLAQAQSSDFSSGPEGVFAQRGTEARLSLTIPFGKSLDKAKTVPRLDFGVRTYAAPSAKTDWMLSAAPDYREARLGFTLGETPQLMLNDQALILSQDEQANIGKAGKIGLGAVALLLVGVATVGVLILTCEDYCDGD